MNIKLGLIIAVILLPLSLLASDDVLPASSEDVKAFDRVLGEARTARERDGHERRENVREGVKAVAEKEVRNAREERPREETKHEKPSREFVREQQHREEMRENMNAIRNDSGRLQRDSIRDEISGSGKDDNSHGGGDGTSGSDDSGGHH